MEIIFYWLKYIDKVSASIQVHILKEKLQKFERTQGKVFK